MIRFPAEWEKQTAVLIAWPHSSGDFGNNLVAVEQTYTIIADTISQYQLLYIVCRDDAQQRHIVGLLDDTQNIEFLLAPVNDIWVRDTVFLSVENANGTISHLNFRFNGWGGKYPHQNDNDLNHKLLNTKVFKGKPQSDIDFILEGGSVESDGLGSILTTKQCLLNPNRNASLSQTEIEQQLAVHLGAKRVLWLDQENLSGDDTDAHIDTLARFCSANSIAYTSCDNPDDIHYAGLKFMENQLQDFRTREGNCYHLTALPLPEPIFDEEGRQLPANYANFLIINHAVLVPAYGDPMDAVAKQRLSACFPDHHIIQIPCRPLVQQYGSLHCMTMQFPEGGKAI